MRVRLGSMPITRNVARDGRLKDFKGRGSAQYVLAAAATARTCSVCGRQVQEGEPASLSVDIGEGAGPGRQDTSRLIPPSATVHVATRNSRATRQRPLPMNWPR